MFHVRLSAFIRGYPFFRKLLMLDFYRRVGLPASAHRFRAADRCLPFASAGATPFSANC
jgi:hypothetical protein